MRVCVLANSHVAALKLAWDESKQRSWEPTFFGAAGSQLKKLKLGAHGKALTTDDVNLRKKLMMTSNGKSTIELDDFDAFAIVGLQVKLQTAMLLFRRFQPLQYRLSDDSRLISEGAFLESVRGAANKSTAAVLLRYLSKVNKPIFLVPAPIPNERAMLHPAFRWLKAANASKSMEFLRDISMRAWTDLATSTGAILIGQPLETVSELGLTKMDFAKGGARLNGTAYDGVDHTHTNAKFGRLILDEIEAKLKS